MNNIEPVNQEIDENSSSDQLENHPPFIDESEAIEQNEMNEKTEKQMDLKCCLG